MSRTAPLLIEIGCEEIPARMIPRATGDLAEIVAACLERAGLASGVALPADPPEDGASAGPTEAGGGPADGGGGLAGDAERVPEGRP